jgi:molecular chaperone GrpE
MELEKDNSQKKSDTEDLNSAKQNASQPQAAEGQQSAESAPEEGQSLPEDQELDAIKAELEKAKGEIETFKDRYMRARAETENMRRRHEKEKSDLLKYGSEKIMTDILPILDSFEKALQAAPEGGDDGSFVEGMRMVEKQLIDVLSKHGLQQFESAGQPFDPNRHQAIQRLEDNVDEETVHDEFQKGYLLADRLLRPAIVSVAVPGEDKPKDT